MKQTNKNDESPLSNARTRFEKPTLGFVYNADSGVFNLAADIAHKFFSPQTYNCNLCALTHNAFKMKNEWRLYLDMLDARFEFLHADEFKTLYAAEVAAKLPAVFSKESDKLKSVISADEINSCRTIDELKQIINVWLKDLSETQNI
ncbi:MAG: hypothetical protein M3033_07530 [Acidobacteriota bacterium]|nr:hypothetical protein [Acidobacteriota bacterium]